jgi:hypothetical protein
LVFGWVDWPYSWLSITTTVLVTVHVTHSNINVLYFNEQLKIYILGNKNKHSNVINKEIVSCLPADKVGMHLQVVVVGTMVSLYETSVDDT